MTGTLVTETPIGVDVIVVGRANVDLTVHSPWDDLLAFVFDGGQLSHEQAAGLTPRDGELTAYEFCTIEQAHQRLRPYVSRRLTAALDARNSGQVHYLVNGYPMTAG